MEQYLHDLRAVFEAGVERVNPYHMMENHLALQGTRLTVRGVHSADGEMTLSLDDFDRIHVIGTGKATARMAKAVEDILGDRISAGGISVKYGHTEPLKIIETVVAGHPVPDENSVEGGTRITELARQSDEKTLVINLISGGGSALLVSPYADDRVSLSLADKQKTTEQLLESGAGINEINCVRKHLSGIKGGRLAGMLSPATVFSFILSDVVGDRLDAIASGPAVPDGTTFDEMAEIIRKYDMEDRLPEAVRTLVDLGTKEEIPDTPKEGDPAFEKTHTILIGTNYHSLQAAAETAEKLGYHPVILSSRITGEAREVARVLFGIARDTADRNLLASRPCCLIAGGETTVTLRGKGKGGRNQEMALAFLAEIEKDPDGAAGIFFLSGATDGGDGPTDAAGAFAASEIYRQAQEKEISIADALKNNDAYHFFEKLGYLLTTGPTYTNVCDIQLMMIP